MTSSTVPPAVPASDQAWDPETGRWRRAPDVIVHGLVEGSGLRERSYLVERGDGQMVHLSELLYLVLREAGEGRDAADLAAAVSRATGRLLPVAGLERLARSKLAPMGLLCGGPADSAGLGSSAAGTMAAVPALGTTAGATGEQATSASQAGDAGQVQSLPRNPAAPVARRTQPRTPPRANPILGLRLRATLLPAVTVRRLARPLVLLYRAPFVVAALVGLVVVDAAVLASGQSMHAMESVLATPTFLLALFALMTVGALVHECGHAVGCRAGGAEPGAIGVGVYLLFPVFYTDVTQSYRLGRVGRLRTDLGGLYFNTWAVLAAGIGYLVTGQPVLLLLLVLTQVEMAQQLVPTVRFDGYYVLADLAGVPDLFARVRPVLATLLTGRPTDPRVAELRPSARRLITAWVLVVVPTLLAGLGWLLWHLPRLLASSVAAIRAQADLLAVAWAGHDVAAAVLAVLAMVLLAVPLAGLSAALLATLTNAVQRFRPRPRIRAATPSPAALSPVLMSAALTSQTHTSEVVMSQTVTSEAGSPQAAGPQPDDQQATGKQPDDQQPAGAADPRPTPETARERQSRDAEEFRDELMLPPRRMPAQRGWRLAARRASGGRINLGPGPAEQREQALIARVRRPVEGPRRIVVLSRKGGVGKTTVTFALGATIARLRGDRVVAVDANPDAGNLGHRVGEPVGHTVTDVLGDLERIDSYAQLRRYTAQTAETPLEVLASNDDARISAALGRQEYHRVVDLLDHFYSLILVDTGTGILDSANQGLLSEADQLIVVLRPALDSGRAAALTLDWLDAHGHPDLVAGAVVVLNAARRGVGLPVAPLEEHFAGRCRRVCQLPWDPALEEGARTSLADLRPTTQEALLELAAAVADGLDEPHAEHTAVESGSGGGVG